MLQQLFNYKKVLAVIIVAGIAYFWKGRSALGSDLSQRHNWTVAHVAILFILVNIAITSSYLLLYFVDASFLPYAYTSYLGLEVGLNILGLTCFFYYVGQPLSTVGCSRGSWASLGLPGVLVALIALFLDYVAMGLCSVLAPSLSDSLVVANIASYFEQNGTLRPMGFLLLEEVFWFANASIEEIEYRGLLYGALRKSMAPLPAQLLSAAAFMAAHGWVNPYAFAVGWVTASLREKYQSLIPGIVFHVVWNVGLEIEGLTIRGTGVAPPMFYVSAAALTGVAYVAVFRISGLWTRWRADPIPK